MRLIWTNNLTKRPVTPFSTIFKGKQIKQPYIFLKLYRKASSLKTNNEWDKTLNENEGYFLQWQMPVD